MDALVCQAWAYDSCIYQAQVQSTVTPEKLPFHEASEYRRGISQNVEAIDSIILQ